jgi:hypothetical protein
MGVAQKKDKAPFRPSPHYTTRDKKATELPTTSYSTSKNLIPILQLLDMILQEFALALGRQRPRGNDFNVPYPTWYL